MTCFRECCGPLPIAISKNSLKLDQEVKVYEVWIIAQTLNSLELSCSRKKKSGARAQFDNAAVRTVIQINLSFVQVFNQLINSKFYMSQELKIIIGVFNY